MTRLLLGALLLAACHPSDSRIELRDAYAFQPVLGDVGSAYLMIVNRGRQADTVTGAEVQGALLAMIHEQAEVGGQETMRHVGRVPVPGGGVVSLRPGGLHLMIEGFERSPVVGDTLTITLHFVRAGALAVLAPVLAYGAAP